MNTSFFKARKIILSKFLVISIIMTAAFSSSAQSVQNQTTGLSYTTIQLAINAATNGDVLLASTGTFTQNVTVNKSVTLRGAQFGVNPNPSRTGSETILNGTFSIQANGVTIDGFEFIGSGSAVRGGGAGPWSNISILNNRMIGKTGGQPILNGFGSPSTTIGSSNWSVSRNRIENIQANNATGMVLFNIVTLNVSDNVINHTNLTFTGRRGINLDGCQSVNVTGNSIDVGLVNPLSDNSDGALTNAVWALQLAASSQTANNILVDGNIFKGAYAGMITLGNGIVSNITIRNNDILSVAYGIFTQGDGMFNTPSGAQTNFLITNNAISSSNKCIFLPDGGTSTNDPYTNIRINNNSLLRTIAGFALDVPTTAIVTDGPVNATCNWFGSADPNVVATRANGQVTYIPYLINGTDVSSAIGFQTNYPCNGVPDLSSRAEVTPQTLTTSSTLNIRVRLLDLNGYPTIGTPIVVRIPKSSRYSFTWDPTLTATSQGSVNNSEWTYSETTTNYVFTLTNPNQAPFLNKYFGIIGTFNSNGTNGNQNITATVTFGSGQETNGSNNVDIQTVTFFN